MPTGKYIRKKGPRYPLKVRFEKHIQIEPMTGCSLWTGSSDAIYGYGQLRVKGRNKRATHIAYELYIGPIPEGLNVLHKCDTPACCNPRDLYAGTDTDNMQDCVRRGRLRPGHFLGTDHPMHKLTDKEVLQIRKDERRPFKIIAKDYGVTDNMISKIIRKVYWKHLA